MISDSNSNVFVDDYVTLKENLTDEIEYSLLPKPAWDKLLSWYGLQQGQVCVVKSRTDKFKNSPHYKCVKLGMV